MEGVGIMAEDIFEETAGTSAGRPAGAPAAPSAREDVFDESPLQPLRSAPGASWLKRILALGGLLFGILLIGGGVWLFSQRPGPPAATEPKAHRFAIPEADIQTETIDPPQPAPAPAVKAQATPALPEPAPAGDVPAAAAAGSVEVSSVGAAAGAAPADTEAAPAVSIPPPAVPAAPEPPAPQAAVPEPAPAAPPKTTASSPPGADRPTPAQRYPLTDQDHLLRQSDFQQAAENFLAELRNHPNAYAVSLEVDCEPQSVRSALKRGQFDASMYVLPKRLGQRNCFAVMWGLYPSADEARRALAELPPYFKTRTPRTAVVPARRYF